MRTPTTARRRHGLWLAAALTGVVALTTTAAVVDTTEAMWAQTVDVALPTVQVRMVDDGPAVQCPGEPLFFPEELRGDDGAFDQATFQEWGGWAEYAAVIAQNPNPFDWDGDGFSDGHDPDPCDPAVIAQVLPCRAGLNEAADLLYVDKLGGDPTQYDDRYVDWDGDGYSDAYELGLILDTTDGPVYYLDVDGSGSVLDPPRFNQRFVDLYGDDLPADIPARSNPCAAAHIPAPTMCVGLEVSIWAINVTRFDVVDGRYFDSAYADRWFSDPGFRFAGDGPWSVEVKAGAPGAVWVSTRCENDVVIDDLAKPPVCVDNRIVEHGLKPGTYGDWSLTVDGQVRTVTWNLDITSRWQDEDQQAEIVIAFPADWVSNNVGSKKADGTGGGVFQDGYSNQTLTVDGMPVKPTFQQGKAEYRFHTTPNQGADSYPVFHRVVTITYTTSTNNENPLGMANVLATMFVDNPNGDWMLQGASTTVTLMTDKSITCAKNFPQGWLLPYKEDGEHFVKDDAGKLVWKPAPPTWFNG